MKTFCLAKQLILSVAVIVGGTAPAWADFSAKLADGRELQIKSDLVGIIVVGGKPLPAVDGTYVSVDGDKIIIVGGRVATGKLRNEAGKEIIIVGGKIMP